MSRPIFIFIQSSHTVIVSADTKPGHRRMSDPAWVENIDSRPGEPCRAGPVMSTFTPFASVSANVVDSSSVCEAGKEGTGRSKLWYQLKGCSQIVAIGRNYADHIKEFNNPRPKEPFFFLKPTTSYLASGGKFEIPNGVIAHYEGPSPPF